LQSTANQEAGSETAIGGTGVSAGCFKARNGTREKVSNTEALRGRVLHNERRSNVEQI
jgi:hypothetical protein